VKLLLDTHCWLWLNAEPERLRRAALEATLDESNEVYFSAASAWEIVIKYALGKLSLPLPPASYVPSRVTALGLIPLSVAQHHPSSSASPPARTRSSSSSGSGAPPP
jgi:PIN domain nuclease of toxin-antitoxin system